ncbi:helicase-associated domain-containing protein [Paenibacillus methanolicus]|uniref:Helicase XPB/Ssl2 N-terminal domain-containing protein n=1 Tax=Paenibacillus methanolicus TaxID=582686 RepID=A0A5S5C2M6_9BACL|nr:helicase-associated domain-containing protein [Paenibacillus methanolicus]TYP72676.1 hypothetical protein BCM02_108331 [Paenibacillus methanolicus]
MDETRKRIECLSPNGRQTLQSLMKQFGMLPFRDEQLLRHVHPGCSGAEYRLGLIELELAGLLKSYRKGWGDKVFMMPGAQFRRCWREVYPTLHPIAVDESTLQFSLDAIEEESPLPLGERLMHGVAELVNCGLAQTSKGSWPKRTIEKVVRALAMKEYDLAQLKLAAREPSCPLPYALFLDFALHEGWLVLEGRDCRLETRRLLSWLNQTQAKRESALVAFWTDQYAAAVPSLANAAAFVFGWPALQWCSPAHLEERFAMAIFDWCRLMTSLGWMEKAVTLGGQHVYRWVVDLGEATSDSAGPPYAQIAPDGDVFVPREGPQYAAFGLELIARRVSSDVVGVYRLEADPLRKAAESGISGERIFTFLNQINGEAVPLALVMAIEGWMSEGSGEMRETAKSRTFDALLSKNENKECPAPAAPEDRPVVLPHDTKEMTELRPSDPAALFQGLDSVPVTWRSQMRQYHPSTRRELVERALIWRTAVKLNIRGQAVPFIPDKLVEDEEGWRVTGDLSLDGQVERTLLAPHMWDEMMLVIPEFTKY